MLGLDAYDVAANARLDPAVFAHLDSGAGDEVTVRANRRAWDEFVLRPRRLTGLAEVSTETEILGAQMAMPVFVAPLGFQELVAADGARASMRAAARAGAGFVAPTISTTPPREFTTGNPRWFQLYAFSDRALTHGLVAQAVEAGFDALVVTVDAPRIGRRERGLRGGWTPDADLIVAGLPLRDLNALVDASFSWRDLERLAAFGLPLVLKGILTAEDALLAVEHGVAGVVVSNHGGRQLDGSVASAHALPEVVEAVAGRAVVLVDGGIRRGEHVLTALALGAHAVMVGRPVLWALAAGGEDEVVVALELLREELSYALRLVGCATPTDVTRTTVARRAA